ncbi:hypothetical protein I2I05_19025 [Hymenobacter sp. BT683]|uniref:Uncharacterized protein n=1 Tax=Hymenobacter jeongseonensis TaxID=2791027 RepID=A0ABS0IN94_9BACT|nr:hypothetical protein [Hymenobacter jeongseonensis]MBF9239494.1 hypothetical protein [Hymenobacter jeongseonensis]
MTDRQKYFHLLALVCEDLHASAVDVAVRGGHEASSVKLMGVRHGRYIKLAWLIDLVRIGLPDFSIPAELLPAEKQVQEALFPIS